MHSLYTFSCIKQVQTRNKDVKNTVLRCIPTQNGQEVNEAMDQMRRQATQLASANILEENTGKNTELGSSPKDIDVEQL